MAIAFGTVTPTASVNAASGSFAHIAGSGSDRVLLAVFSIAGGESVSGPTYAGVAMTLGKRTANGTNQAIEIWYLEGPATGSNTLAYTLSALQKHHVTAIDCTGVDQALPVGPVTGSATGSNNSPSVSWTPEVQGVALAACSLRNNNGGPFTPGSGVTELYDPGGGNENNAMFVGYKAITSGSHTVNATASNSGQWAMAGISLQDSTGVATGGGVAELVGL